MVLYNTDLAHFHTHTVNHKHKHLHTFIHAETTYNLIIMI